MRRRLTALPRIRPHSLPEIDAPLASGEWCQHPAAVERLLTNRGVPNGEGSSFYAVDVRHRFAGGPVDWDTGRLPANARSVEDASLVCGSSPHVSGCGTALP